MSYFIFIKDLDNIDNTIYRIADTQTDLENLNLNQSYYKIIVDSQDNFNAVKLIKKQALKYNQDTITFIDVEVNFQDKIDLNKYILMLKQSIKDFLDNNPNHPIYEQWNNYYNQLNNLNLDSITYPLNKSLQQYFNDLGQPSLNPLQLP